MGFLHSSLPYFPFPHPLPCPVFPSLTLFPALFSLAPQFFPSGIPEEQLRRLGQLSRLYTEQEISQWQVTTSATVSALLNPSGGHWDDSQVNPRQQKAMGDEEPKLGLLLSQPSSGWRHRGVF